MPRDRKKALIMLRNRRATNEDDSMRRLPILLRPRGKEVDLSTQHVVVRVGNPSKSFHVNQALMCDHSEYFRLAMKPTWTEGRDSVVDMHDDDPAAFNTYLNWLYSRRLCLDFDESSKVQADEPGIWFQVVDAYALGDKLLDADFKDAVTDAAVLMLTKPRDDLLWQPDSDPLRHLYDKTVPDCGLRRAVVHAIARTPGTASWIEETVQHATFLADMVKELLKDPTMFHYLNDTVAAAGRCEFHEHPEGNENCYRVKYL